MDEFMTGHSFPDPMVWILGVAIVVAVGWLIERWQNKARRVPPRTQAPTQPVPRNAASDLGRRTPDVPTEQSVLADSSDDNERPADAAALYSELHHQWDQDSDGYPASVLESPYSSDEFVLRVKSTDGYFNDLTRLEDRWVSYYWIEHSPEAVQGWINWKPQDGPRPYQDLDWLSVDPDSRPFMEIADTTDSVEDVLLAFDIYTGQEAALREQKPIYEEVLREWNKLRYGSPASIEHAEFAQDFLAFRTWEGELAGDLTRLDGEWVILIGESHMPGDFDARVRLTAGSTADPIRDVVRALARALDEEAIETAERDS
jgi:hypothetical protein